MRALPRPVLTALLAASLAAPGCGPGGSSTAVDSNGDAHEHNHHEHDHHHAELPASLSAAVDELTQMHQSIRAAVQDGNADDAHDPLHEVRRLLEVLPELAAETDLPEAEWNAIHEAAETLEAAFSSIDEVFHTDGGDWQAAYKEAASGVDGAIEQIRARLPLTGEQAEADNHDHTHDGRDHAEHQQGERAPVGADGEGETP